MSKNGVKGEVVVVVDPVFEVVKKLNGEKLLNLTRVAEMCGVDKSTLSKAIRREQSTLREGSVVKFVKMVWELVKDLKEEDFEEIVGGEEN